jgi:hypothetical protein
MEVRQRSDTPPQGGQRAIFIACPKTLPCPKTSPARTQSFETEQRCAPKKSRLNLAQNVMIKGNS